MLSTKSERASNVCRRYALYNSWKNETYQQHAKLLRRKGDILKKIKFVMKRVTKETIKPMGRQIGKLTHSSPGFLFDYVSSTFNNKKSNIILRSIQLTLDFLLIE